MNGYTLLVGLGATIGLWWVLKSVPRWQAARWINAGLYCLVGILIGARLVFVAIHFSYFSSHLNESFQIWQGGLAWPGAVLGGWLTVILLSFFWRLSLAHTADALIPMLPPLSVSIWMGCWMIGSAYGAAAPAGAWWGLPSPDESGAIAARFPLQPLAAISLLLIFGWLEQKTPTRLAPGLKASLYSFGLAINLFAFSFLRVDPAPGWGGLRLDTWAALGFCILSLLGSLAAALAQRKALVFSHNPKV